MAAAKKHVEEGIEMSVEDKLRALFELQSVDSGIDRIKILRGELPLEVQDLEDEVEGLETRIRNFETEIGALQDSITKKNNEIVTSKGLIKKYQEQQNKKSELDEIISDTKKEEENLIKRSNEIQKSVEQRLVIAYQKIRANARNGLAVVPVQRDACGGCFNKIPPQRQLDIRSRKKIIVCEYCGRILVDFGGEEQASEK